jgi:hypothetical protein
MSWWAHSSANSGERWRRDAISELTSASFAAGRATVALRSATDARDWFWWSASEYRRQADPKVDRLVTVKVLTSPVLESWNWGAGWPACAREQHRHRHLREREQ